jgi:hypothetical protein
VQERDGARWIASISFQRGQDDTRRIEALLAAISGPAGIILLPDFRRLSAKGSLAGSPQLASGSGTTLSLTGFTPNAAGVLMAGDLIQTSAGRMHIVVQDVNADNSGNASVAIAPRLREAVTAGALVTNNVRASMRLVSDDSGKNQTSAQLQSRFDFDLVEVLPTS